MWPVFPPVKSPHRDCDVQGCWYQNSGFRHCPSGEGISCLLAGSAEYQAAERQRKKDVADQAARLAAEVKAKRQSAGEAPQAARPPEGDSGPLTPAQHRLLDAVEERHPSRETGLAYEPEDLEDEPGRELHEALQEALYEAGAGTLFAYVPDEPGDDAA